MTNHDVIALAGAAWIALLVVVGYTVWRRRQLVALCRQLKKAMDEEWKEIDAMRVTLIQQHEWDSTKGHPGNKLVRMLWERRVETYNERARAYNEAVNKMLRWPFR